MAGSSLARWLVPLGWLVLVGGWALAVASFFAIGSETCTTVHIAVVGDIEACQDTTAQSVLLFAVVGFGGTVASLFLWTARWILLTLQDIDENTRRGGR